MNTLATPLPPVRFGPTYYDYYSRELLTNKKYNNLEEELHDDAEDPQEIDHDQELEPEGDTTTTPSTDDLVSASLRCGAVSCV